MIIGEMLATERAVIEMIREERHLLATEKMNDRVRKMREGEIEALESFRVQLAAERMRGADWVAVP